jgi:hypothetical protein
MQAKYTYGPRRHAAGRADVVSGHQQAGDLEEKAFPSGRTARCSSATTACCWPTTASTCCCPKRSSPISSGPSRSFRRRGHHAEWVHACQDGRADHLQLRVRRLAHRSEPPGQRGVSHWARRSNGTPSRSARRARPKPRQSSAASTATAGSWRECSPVSPKPEFCVFQCQWICGFRRNPPTLALGLRRNVVRFLRNRSSVRSEASRFAGFGETRLHFNPFPGRAWEREGNKRADRNIVGRNIPAEGNRCRRSDLYREIFLPPIFLSEVLTDRQCNVLN